MFASLILIIYICVCVCVHLNALLITFLNFLNDTMNMLYMWLWMENKYLYLVIELVLM